MQNVFFNEARRRRQEEQNPQQENWRYASDAQYRTIDDKEQ
jgi:hypothetical protein